MKKKPLPTYLTLTEIINRKVTSGEREIRSYYDPRIEEVRGRMQELEAELKALEEERDECITSMKSAYARPQYTEEMCKICWIDNASEVLPCGHTLCSQCFLKLRVCPWDRKLMP